MEESKEVDPGAIRGACADWLVASHLTTPAQSNINAM